MYRFRLILRAVLIPLGTKPVCSVRDRTSAELDLTSPLCKGKLWREGLLTRNFPTSKLVEFWGLQYSSSGLVRLLNRFGKNRSEPNPLPPKWLQPPLFRWLF